MNLTNYVTRKRNKKEEGNFQMKEIGLKLIVEWLKAKSKAIVELPLMSNGLEVGMGGIQTCRRQEVAILITISQPRMIEACSREEKI
jgi:hypothetical protein